MDSDSTADEHTSDTSDQILDTLHDQYLHVRTPMSQIALLRAHLETSAAKVKAKDAEIAQLRLRLQQASEKEQVNKDKISQLEKDYKSARHREFDLLAEVKQNEAAKRLGTVHRNTDHFIRRDVERLNKANEKLEEEKFELEERLARVQEREREVRRELDELKERFGVMDEAF